MDEVRAYAAKANRSPSWVIQNASSMGGATWAKWEAGGNCTMRIADQIRTWMEENPIPQGAEAVEK